MFRTKPLLFSIAFLFWNKSVPYKVINLVFFVSSFGVPCDKILTHKFYKGHKGECQVIGSW